MNAGRDVERLITGWLVEESPRRAPDRILGHAADVIDRTKQRRLGVAWRLAPMFSNRLAMAGVVVVLVATSALAVNRFASVGPPGPSPSPSAAMSAPPSTAPTVVPTIELPAARQLNPTAVIDLSGQVQDTIPLTTDGTDLWVGVDGALIHINGQTNATRRMDVPAMSTGNGEIMFATDGLWIEDYLGGRVLRIDPASGEVTSTVTISRPRTIHFVDGQLWIGTNQLPGAYLLDRTTGQLGPRIGTTNVFAIGLGNLWIGEWDSVEGDHTGADLISRYDASTGAPAGTIAVPPGTGCLVSGSFPDNVWAACPSDFGTCPGDRTAVRIDPAANEVVATARICGAPVAVVDGTPWFLAGRKDGQAIAQSLVSVDPATGRLLAQLDLGELDPDVIVATDSAIWMSDEQGDRVVRYDFTALRA
jgi:outer membrane protein assembly factor BamB